MFDAAQKFARRTLPEGTLHLVQVTDTHLYADPDTRLLGLNTLGCLREVLAQIRCEQPQPDLVLATGDLVHDASPAGYRRAAEELRSLGVPVFGLPGNHDVSNAMATHLEAHGVSCAGELRLGDWQILLLDSVIPGEEGGRLAPAELQRLETALGEGAEHVLVCLHHQPVSVGSAWIDTMALENHEEFFAILDTCPQVRGVLWGHIHQEYDQWRGNVRLLATPSTCVQFAPDVDDFQVDMAPPGYRSLTLLPDGRIETHVHRLAAYPEGLDLASAGY
jgi:Icc protein